MKLKDLKDRISDISCLSHFSIGGFAEENSPHGFVDTCFHDETLLYRLNGTKFAMMILGGGGFNSIIVWVSDCELLPGASDDGVLITFEDVISNSEPDLIVELLFHIDIFADSSMAFDAFLI